MARTRKYTDTQIIAALKRTRGLIYIAARHLGCHADTIYERAKQSKAIQDALSQCRGEFVDRAESKLMKGVHAGERWAVEYTLSRLGKDRGYVERQEVTGADGGPVEYREVDGKTALTEATALLELLRRRAEPLATGN